MKALAAPISEQEAPAIRTAFLERLRDNQGRIAHACEATGITARQLDWLRKDAEFTAECDLIAEAQRDNTRQVVHQMISDQHPTIVAKAMSALPEYQVTKNVNVKGHVDHVHGLAEMSDEDKHALIAEAANIVELEQGRDYVEVD